MNKAIKTYSFFIFLIFIISMELWIGWGGRKSLMLSLFGCGALFVKIICNIPFNLSRRNIIIVLLFYVAFLYRLGSSFTQVFTQIPSQLIPIICIVCVADKYKEYILHYVTKWYAYMILLSMLVYIFVSIMPISGFGYIEFAPESNYGVFTNYILYVESLRFATDSFIRFNGPFLEPGYVGMIGAFLLFANGFNLKKKENIPIFISVLLSFSLAGYMLMLIGYIIRNYYIGEINIARLIFSILIILSFIGVAKNYNNGENIVNERILSRLEYNEERGFSGNNRNTETIELLALGMWAGDDMDIILFGYNKKFFNQFEEWELVGSGFDKFLVHHGLIGIILALSLYIIIVTTARDKKFALLFLIFVIISFWQRCYALWFSWIICFYYASVITDRFKYNKNIKQL